MGVAGAVQPAGSRPGWRVTFLSGDKKVTKEAPAKLSVRHRALVEARALRLACPARTSCYRRLQSLQRWFGSADRHLNRQPHAISLALPRSSLHSPDWGGTAVECAALTPAGSVRAEQASRSARAPTSARCRTLSLESASLSNFLAQQKVGRLPGRDPARCTAPAKPTQGAQTRQSLMSAPSPKLPPGRPLGDSPHAPWHG